MKVKIKIEIGSIFVNLNRNFYHKHFLLWTVKCFILVFPAQGIFENMISCKCHNEANQANMFADAIIRSFLSKVLLNTACFTPVHIPLR